MAVNQPNELIDDLWIIPVNRTVDTVYDPAIQTDNKGGRKHQHIPLGGNLTVAIQ